MFTFWVLNFYVSTSFSSAFYEDKKNYPFKREAVSSPNNITQELHLYKMILQYDTRNRTTSTVCGEADDGCPLYWMGTGRVMDFKDPCWSLQSVTFFCRSLHLQNETSVHVRDRAWGELCFRELWFWPYLSWVYFKTVRCVHFCDARFNGCALPYMPSSFLVDSD